MNITPNEVERLFGGKLHGSKIMKRYVCRVVATLPTDIIDHLTRDCWFLGSTEDAWAYSFRGDEIAGKHMIVLSDTLFMQPAKQIQFTIAHEIGHIVLGHRNSILGKQTKAEIIKQEREADAFASRYI